MNDVTRTTRAHFHTTTGWGSLDVAGSMTFGALGYHGLFEDWTDVTRQFEVTVSEPDEVLLARYVDEDYSGDADVVFRSGGTYHWASGSHCSCMGLEGQWEPEAYTLDLLIGAVERRLPAENSYHHYRTWEGGGVARELIELHSLLTMRRTVERLCPPPQPVPVPSPEPEPVTPPEPPTLSAAVEATLRKLAGY